MTQEDSMAIKRAKTLTDEQFENLLSLISFGLHPERDRAMVGLSFKCGLRAMEIAGLRWRHVTDAMGVLLQPGSFIELGHDITKGAKPDTKVIMHPFVFEALTAIRSKSTSEWVIYAPRGGPMTANNVTVYLYNLYKRAGFEGCSSHTGRRTFGTALSRKCNLFGGSIADVQELMRHSDIRTTRIYIDPSETQRKLAMNV
jgi:integrase